ncbi:DNA polymerase III subunit beta [Vibrio parahaemolyticus]|uniref:DNA polymerase III subunit beta n=1 Tax=Vibrio parahaemolyticus TaxID=670 RepID=UPI0023ECC0E5|nr:DNA polymerase III subunit beta [Vibrio parahaemolyticus]
MELIADNSQALLHFIGHACNNADSRQTGIDSFDFVSIENKGGTLSITGSNGAQSFTRLCQADAVQAKGEGHLCVDAGKLFQVVRTLPKGQPVKLKMVKGKDRAVVSSGRSRLQLKTIDPTNYPKVDILDDKATRFTVPAINLIGLLNDAAYAAGKNDSRVYLNSVYLQVKNQMLYAIASDGHRLSANKHPIEGAATEMQLLLPINAVQVFSRLSEKHETIEVAFNDSRAEFNWGGLVYRTALVDAKYPDVMKLMPTNCASKISANRVEFMESLKRLLVMVSGEKFPKIKLTYKDEQMKFQTIITNEEDGMGEDVVAGKLSGDPMNYEYGVNPKYLLDALSHMHTEEVELLFNDVHSSCSIAPVGSKLARALIMPVRV